MRRRSVVRALATAMLLLGIVVGTAQDQGRMPRKVPGTSKPECAQGSICFSGQIRESQAFLKELNADLELVIVLTGGFHVMINHADANYDRLSWIADTPFLAHKQTEIDA